MDNRFRLLFSPLKVGPMVVRNRTMFTAHSTLYLEKQLMGERETYYYAERARGGVGTIVTGQVMVHPTCGFSRPVGYLEEVILSYRAMSSAVHGWGAKLLVQLNHIGGQVEPEFDALHEIWAPSPTPCPKSRTIMAKAMEAEDIEETIDGFAVSAQYAQAGGMDGVEVQAAHGYLISSFLSSFSNRRTDEYGGSLDNRLRLLIRVVDAIRERCGSDFVIGVRLNGDDFVQGGLALADSRAIASRLEARGTIDYISVSSGSYLSPPLATAPMIVPPGSLVYLAAGIKEVVRTIPVVTVGRINDPVQAEQILANGYADMIGMTRALIADPEFPNKAREGRLEDIRSCVACNQGCIARLNKGRPITCIHNAAVGREKAMGIGTIERAPVRKKVLVVGGGPAGLEAARVAAMRGHRVSLYEKSDRLGGQVNLACMGPQREEFAGITRYLGQQVTNLGVQISLNAEAVSHQIQGMAPDAVVIATGSIPDRKGVFPLRSTPDSVPGIEQDNVITAWDVFRESVTIGDSVVVIDELGDQQGLAIAYSLIERGRSVEVLSTLSVVGAVLVATRDQSFLYKKLLPKGLRLSPYTALKAIRGNTIIASNVWTGEERHIEKVHTVVLVGNKANDELYWLLKGQVNELYRIGDCVAPRNVAYAIYEGNVVGRKL